jgi:transitional endoplasmic reticulum ATPase
MKTIKLKVAEAIQDDVNKGIVRVDSSFMHEIGVRPGDIVRIKGERPTVGIVDRAYPGDIGLNIIRMDGILRRNTLSSLGDMVEVTKCEAKEATKVVISPATKEIVNISPSLFKQGLLGRALMKGDIVSLGGTKRRKNTLSQNPFFDDVFNVFDESLINFGLGELKFSVSDTIPKEAVFVTDLTEVVFNPQPVELKEQGTLEVTYEDIGGLTDEVKKVREMVELPLKHPEIFERLGIEPPRGVLLHGPPGTGKTLLAKAVANETNANFILINGPEIISKFLGQSEMNIRKKFEEAEKNAPSIIFIDEIDAIALKREESQGEEKRVVAQLLTLMDGLKSRGKVVVIAASNIPNSLDPALRRPGRFDREIEIGVPDKTARLNILKIHTRNMPLGDDVNLEYLSEITHGFVGADLAALCKESAMAVLRRNLPDLRLKEDETIPQEILERLLITQNDFIEGLKTVRPSAMREIFVETPNVKWDDVGGLLDVKRELIETVEWPITNAKSFLRLGIKPPKGILLYGPPGTGKTLLAKAIATESKLNFIAIKGSELLSKWVNETPQLVKKLFQKARQVSPTILFIDEIDSIAESRNNKTDGKSGMTAINQLLIEMDGMETLNDVIVIAATNRPDILDPALLRPGRFDRIIYTSVPDKEARLQIFSVCTKSMPLIDVDLNILAENTQGYVGADIDLICREAAVFALREDINAQGVMMHNFESALLKVSASVTTDIEENYKSLYETFRKAKGNEIKKDKPSYYG